MTRPQQPAPAPVGGTPFDRFRALTQKILTTPKAELVKDQPRKPMKGKSRKR